MENEVVNFQFFESKEEERLNDEELFELFKKRKEKLYDDDCDLLHGDYIDMLWGLDGKIRPEDEEVFGKILRYVDGLAGNFSDYCIVGQCDTVYLDLEIVEKFNLENAQRAQNNVEMYDRDELFWCNHAGTLVDDHEDCDCGSS